MSQLRMKVETSNRNDRQVIPVDYVTLNLNVPKRRSLGPDAKAL